MSAGRRRWGRASFVAIVVAAGIALARPAPVTAQVTAADSAAVLLETARSFAGQGRNDVADALYRWIADRYPGTPAAAAARASLQSLSPFRESSGSTELQVWGTLYGAWLGVGIPGAFGAESNEAYGLGLLVGAPAGFIASRAVARRTDLTIGQARAITLGGTWGTWQGFGWQEVFDLGEGLECFGDLCTNEGGEEEALAAMVLGGLGGVALGAILSRRAVSDAVATGANYGALWGSWFGVGIGVLADLEGDDLLAATLVGGDAGLVGGALMTPGLGWSRNRWRVVSAIGLLGGVAGAGIDLLLSVDDEKAAIATPLVASAVGLAVGAAVTDGDEDRSPAPAPGALLSFGSTGPALGHPLPMPRMLPVETRNGARWRPTLGFTLVRATF